MAIFSQIADCKGLPIGLHNSTDAGS